MRLAPIAAAIDARTAVRIAVLRQAVFAVCITEVLP